MDPNGRDFAHEIEAELAEVFEGHGLRLTESNWKRDLVKKTLTLSVKVSGDLAKQGDLPLEGGI